MKRFTMILLTLLLVAAMLAIPVSAANERVCVTSNVSGLPGETVFVTVSLSGFENVDAIGVEYSGLEANPDASKWTIPEESGEDQLTDIAQAEAVYGSTVKKNISGDVLTLAFTVPEDPTASSYTVSFEVTVNYGGVLYETSAQTVISVEKPATEITLDQTAVSLDLCGTKSATVIATVAPDDSTDTLTWTSSNTAVATVSNGVITAVKPGTATVTVSANDNVSATCQITVTCSHTNKTETAAKNATCTAPGNNKYFTCNTCMVVLKADGQTETTVADETLAQLDHVAAEEWTYDDQKHWHECTNDGCSAKLNETEHTYGADENCTVCAPVDTVRGDLDGDGDVTDLDVEYLLWYTLFPEDFPITSDADYDGDGDVTDLDVEYLLWHTLFPEDFPL